MRTAGKGQHHSTESIGKVLSNTFDSSVNANNEGRSNYLSPTTLPSTLSRLRASPSPRVQRIRLLAEVSKDTFVRAGERLFADLGTRWNERFGESSTQRTRHAHEKGAFRIANTSNCKK